MTSQKTVWTKAQMVTAILGFSAINGGAINKY